MQAVMTVLLLITTTYIKRKNNLNRDAGKVVVNGPFM